MGWNRQRHENALADAIVHKDLDKVEKLAQEATEHDREVARQTGQIFWAHKRKW